MSKSKSTRRKFIKQSSAISLGFFGLQSFMIKGCDDPSGEVLQQLNMPYGQLFEDENKLLKLPKLLKEPTNLASQLFCGVTPELKHSKKMVLIITPQPI